MYKRQYMDSGAVIFSSPRTFSMTMRVDVYKRQDVIRLREELSEQYRALGQMKKMAASYGYDISGPAKNAREAVQWLYFGYLAAIKTQNGAAMSVGRISCLLYTSC